MDLNLETGTLNWVIQMCQVMHSSMIPLSNEYK